MRALRVLLVAVLAPLLAACPPSVNRCAEGTLYVSITLEGEAQAATQFLIDISVGSGGAMRSTLPHTPGVTSGSIEIAFPKGYPSGQNVTVTITAQQGTTALATQSATLLLDEACKSATIVLSTTTSDLGPLADIAPPPADADLSVPQTQDLLEADLANATQDDLTAPVDLIPPTDFTGVALDLSCVPSTEDCFNNVDDDCDGLIDCADPDCTGGSTPKAVCAPNPGTFTPGAKINGAACPSVFPNQTPIFAGLNHGCTNACTGCASSRTVCTVPIKYGPNPSCVSGASYLVSQSTDCQSYNIPAGDYHVFDTPFASGACATATGNATPYANWTESSTFCSGRIGGGCSSGSVCVPKAPSQCVMKAGLASCPSGYDPASLTFAYYTGFSNNGQSCSCGCIQNDDGVCTGTPNFTAYSDFGCSMNATSVSVGCSNQDISAGHGLLTGLVVSTPATCSAAAFESNEPTPTGRQTVCCVP